MLKWTKYGSGNEVERNRRELEKNQLKLFEIGKVEVQTNLNCGVNKFHNNCEFKISKTVKEKGRRNAIKRFKNEKWKINKHLMHRISLEEEFYHF